MKGFAGEWPEGVAKEVKKKVKQLTSRRPKHSQVIKRLSSARKLFLQSIYESLKGFSDPNLQLERRGKGAKLDWAKRNIVKQKASTLLHSPSQPEERAPVCVFMLTQQLSGKTVNFWNSTDSA